MANVYNLTEIPESVIKREHYEWDVVDHESHITWSGGSSIPAIGDMVDVNFNRLGAGVVTSYFIEYGFLGVAVRLDTPPEWHVKQNAGKDSEGVALVFGAEIKDKK